MKYTEKRKELNKKLAEICDIDEYLNDFILGTNLDLKSDKEVTELLEYLNKYDNVSTDEATVKAMEIAAGRRLEINGVTTRD